MLPVPHPAAGVCSQGGAGVLCRGDILSPITATPGQLNCPRNAFWMPHGWCMAAGSRMLAPFSSMGKYPGPPPPGLTRIFICQKRNGCSRVSLAAACCPCLQQPHGHGAGRSSSPWFSAWDHSPAEAPELGSATLNMPQHSGTRPSSRSSQHPEQTGQVPKPRALAGYTPHPKLRPSCGWTGGTVDLRVHGPLHTFVRTSSAPAGARGTAPSIPWLRHVYIQ